MTCLGENGILSDDCRPVVVFKKGRSYRAINVQKIRVIGYEIDGVLIKQGHKCDYALCLPDKAKLYFVELKGHHLPEAAEQILTTIQYFAEELAEMSVFGRIVCTRISTPDLRSVKMIKLERELAKRNGNLVKKVQLLEEEIE